MNEINILPVHLISPIVMEALQLLTKEDMKLAPKFMFTPEYGRVFSVYDGDTFRMITTFENKYVNVSVRILGIDCPELRTKNADEKEKALAAKHFLKSLILDKVVKLTNHKKDKYGRICARVWLDSVDIAASMIENKHARFYYGGTKLAW